MRFSVVDRYFDVLHRVAGDKALGQYFAHAFFDGRNEVKRNGSALDFIDKLESFAAGQGFDTQIHFTELTGTARLFLVTRMTFGLAANRFTVRNGRSAGLHFKVKLGLHTVQNRS